MGFHGIRINQRELVMNAGTSVERGLESDAHNKKRFGIEVVFHNLPAQSSLGSKGCDVNLLFNHKVGCVYFCRCYGRSVRSPNRFHRILGEHRVVGDDRHIFGNGLGN